MDPDVGVWSGDLFFMFLYIKIEMMCMHHMHIFFRGKAMIIMVILMLIAHEKNDQASFSQLFLCMACWYLSAASKVLQTNQVCKDLFFSSSSL